MRKFKSTSFGTCKKCVLAYRNYNVFKKLVNSLNPSADLPAKLNTWVKQRLKSCKTEGWARQTCESQDHDLCTFRNYLIDDPDLKSSCTKASTKFSALFGIEFDLQEEVDYWTFVQKPQILSNRRKYDCDVLAKISSYLSNCFIVFSKI